jgi:HSP20 family protein
MNNGLITRSSLFDDFFNDIAPGFFVKPLHGDPLPSQIKVDLKESPEAYTVQAEIPGVSKDDIQVNVNGNSVTFKAEVKQEDRRKDENVLRNERYFGAVSRSVTLPVDIDNSQSKAKYENGVLTLTLPKRTSTPNNRLTVE